MVFQLMADTAGAGDGIILEKKRYFLLKNVLSSATICNDIVNSMKDLMKDERN